MKRQARVRYLHSKQEGYHYIVLAKSEAAYFSKEKYELMYKYTMVIVDFSFIFVFLNTI